MLQTVHEAIEGIRKAFPDAVVDAIDDGSGGAYVLTTPVLLGPRFVPETTWIGGHIPPQFPYADIYPVFIDGNVRFANGQAFVAPISLGHTFCGRPAIQVSRKTNRLDPQLQTAASKFQKVIYWLTQQ